MPKETLELRISFHKLLIALGFTVIPICSVGLYSLSHSQASLENMVGTHFHAIALSGAAEVSQFIHDRVTSVGIVANGPTIVELVTNSNRSYAGMSEEAIASRINAIEKIWNTPAADARVREILSNPAARRLRRYRELDRRFLRITVTDAKGATVAATHKTLDYFQADEEFWQAIYAQGRGAVNLTDILYDDVTKTHYIGIGVPILEEGSNRFIGVVDALLEVSSILPLVNRPSVGATARAIIVKEDGTVIAAPQANLAMRLKSSEFEAVRDTLGNLEGRQRGWITATLPNGVPHLIAFADTGLKQDYGSLGWYVLLSQETRESFAPIRGASRMLVLMALIGLLTVIFLTVYFSLHRRQTFTDIKTEAQQKPAQA